MSSSSDDDDTNHPGNEAGNGNLAASVFQSKVSAVIQNHRIRSGRGTPHPSRSLKQSIFLDLDSSEDSVDSPQANQDVPQEKTVAESVFGASFPGLDDLASQPGDDLQVASAAAGNLGGQALEDVREDNVPLNQGTAE